VVGGLAAAATLLAACGDSNRKGLPEPPPPPPPPAAPASLQVGDATRAEGNGAAAMLVFSVTVDVPSTRATDFTVDTVDGTAVAGTDYGPISGRTLRVPAGAWSGEVEVAILGDEDFEPDETLELRLTDDGGAAARTYAGTGTIFNDDLRQDLQLGVSYEYDVLGRLVAVRYDTGRSILYTYDAAGNVLSVTSQGE